MCGSCGNSSYGNINNYVSQVERNIEECDYTVQYVESLSLKVECAYTQNLLERVTYNSYKGIIKSILNSPTYICLYKRNIGEMERRLSTVEC